MLSMKKENCSLCVILCAFLFAVLALVAGLVLMFYGFPLLIKNEIKQGVPLTNGTTSFEQWKSPPVPVYMQFWVWNLTNRNEVINNGSKPIIVQMGPYTYKEERVKENITFSEDETTLSYNEPKSYIFKEALSNGSENDTFVTVNLPVLTVAKYLNGSFLRHLPERVKKWIAEKIQNSGDGIYKEYSVFDYLWGFEDPIINKINEELAFFHFPQIHNKFGLFMPPNQNGSSDGVYKIYTGKENVKHINVIETWKNMTHLNYWNKNYTHCNQINGTDGTLFHPFIEKKNILRFFSSDICRSIYAEYVKEVVMKDISLYRFVPPKAVFEDPKDNPANLGFCTTQCFKSGVLDVSVCKNDVPIMLSQPHFYLADPEYINAVIGVHPEKNQHETVLDVEPMTGAVMNVAKRLQINAYITKSDFVEDTKELKKPVIFPLLWLNESAKIDENSASKFKRVVLHPIFITKVVQYLLLGIGGLVLLISIFAGVVIIRKQRKQLIPGEGKSGLVSSMDDE